MLFGGVVVYDGISARNSAAKPKDAAMTNPNQIFSDEQVREIKMNLVAGVGLVALARRWGCSTETIGRMKRGLTYRHVKVLGEEKLRPPIRLVGPTEQELVVKSGVTDEEIERSEKELLGRLAVKEAAREAVLELDPELKKQVERLQGVESFLDEIPGDRLLD